MKQWLTRLQRRPLQQRQAIAVGVAGVLTAMIALVWVVSLPERFAQLSNTSPMIERESAVMRLFAGVREQVGAVRAALVEPPPLAPAQPNTTITESSASTAQAAASTTATGTAPMREPQLIQIATTTTE